MPVLTVTKETIESEVMSSEKPVLLDFYAPWCGPCRMLSPVIDQIADENPEIKVVKVNVDDDPELAKKFGVTSVPTLFAFKSGKVVKKSSGALPKQKILEMFK